MLNTRWSLLDIDDAEQFAVDVARRWCEKTQTRLTFHEEEDLRAYLLSELWRLHERFDPRRHASFGAYALAILPNRATDWMRLRRGRSRWSWSDGTRYERERANVLSLDAPVGSHDSGERTLGELIPDQRSGVAADCAAFELKRLHADRVREEDRHLDILRAAAARFDQERVEHRRRVRIIAAWLLDEHADADSIRQHVRGVRREIVEQVLAMLPPADACAECMERPRVSRGLCRRCYHRALGPSDAK